MDIERRSSSESGSSDDTLVLSDSSEDTSKSTYYRIRVGNGQREDYNEFIVPQPLTLAEFIQTIGDGNIFGNGVGLVNIA